ncbi:hypothetical protein B0H11DRAFT_2223395 [Mycena galericulata]|nr:hypothetical protein B0H11DRAFT_2223395 [Mycena galericulata]
MSTPASGISLSKNRSNGVDRPLGPFDGRVGAHLAILGTPCFVTTHAHYIPEIPTASPSNTMAVRKDMRYGTDDYGRWPQQYSATYCHLGAIPRKPVDPTDSLAVLWWDPAPTDFVGPQSGRSLTSGLGKLCPDQFSRLAWPVNRLIEEYEACVADNVVPFFPLLPDNLRLGLERLQTLPCTYTRMVMGVTNVQRAYLQLAGLISYMTIYKPRMDNSASVSGLSTTPDDRVGVFTSDPVIAQQFYTARLPYWFIRPLAAFVDERILSVATPVEGADCIECQPAPGFPAVATGSNVDEKIQSLDICTRTTPWYTNSFKTEDERRFSSQPTQIVAPVAGARRITQGTNNRESMRGLAFGPIRGSSQGSKSHASRVSPYIPVKAKKESASSDSKKTARNKFDLFSGPEMPSSIPSWTRALSIVDTSQPPLADESKAHVYIFPEPAMLVSPVDENRRQLLLYHYQLVHDALLYRLGDPHQSHAPLTTQEWRDVLQGKVSTRGKRGSKAFGRTVAIEKLLGPAMKACGIELTDFAVDASSVPRTTRNRAKEILWGLAEMNFRFELLALDARASGIDRPDKCRECFAGGNLLGLDIGLSKQGLAAIVPSQRLPYLQRLAELMRDWKSRPRPPCIDKAKDYREWTATTIEELECDVATYYTHSFYLLFGRASVIPMRLDHEFGT